MFHMLEELKGEGAGDAIIDKMTTGVVTYSTDDSEYYNARIQLGKTVEAAIKGEEIEPEPPVIEVEKGDVDGSSTITMTDLFKLKLFVKQIVTPTDKELAAADITGDGLVNMMDSFELKYRIVTGDWRKK